jgi:hypothetical protein
MLTCPVCSALLYSRTSGICPECKSPLPLELQLSDDEKKQRNTEGKLLRQRVVDLQDKSKKKGGLKSFFF